MADCDDPILPQVAGFKDCPPDLFPVELCDGTITDLPVTEVTVRGFVYTKPCPDGVQRYEQVLCLKADPAVKILVVTDLPAPPAAPVPVTTYVNLATGAAWVGNPDTDLETCVDDEQMSSVEDCRTVTVAGSWGAVGDELSVTRFYVEDQADSTVKVFAGQVVYNVTTGTAIPAADATAAITGSVPCKATAELDQVAVAPYLVCVETAGTYTQWYAREVRTVDNETGATTATIVEWSVDGVAWTATAPTGVKTAGECPGSTVFPPEFVHVCTGESCISYERIKTLNPDGTITIDDRNLDGTPVATPLNPLFTKAGPCQTDSCVECTEVFTREPWHVEVVAGEEVAVDFTLTDYTLPEPVANAVAGTTNPNPATTPSRYFAPSVYDGALASGGTWTEPGVQGGVVNYPSQWYGYVGPVSNAQPALWPYAALRVNATTNPDCAPPPTFDIETSFQWRYDGPRLPPLAAPAQAGDMGIFAWLIDVSGPTVVATTSVPELSITAIGQTGVVTFNTSGLTLTQVNNLAVIIAVNPVEGGNDGDFTLPSGSTFLKNTGYTVSRLSLNVTGTAQCPECRIVFREDTCAGERWKDDDGNLIAKPVNAAPGLPAADTIVVELLGYNDPAGCRTIEVVKTISGCSAAVTIAGHELDGTPIVGFDPTLIIDECPTPVVTERQVCIDTGTEIVEAWLVIGRDPNTLEPVVKRYETLDGGEVVGTVVPCDCGPSGPTLEARNTYTGSGIQSYYTDKWGADCGPVTWTVEAFQNGALVYTSLTSPALTSATAAQTWLNTTGGGGYIALNQFNDAPNGNPTVNSWSLPVQSTGEWLLVITENAGNQCVPIAYGFANYDIGGLGNGNATGWWDTIGTTGLNPTNGPVNYNWNVG